MNNSENLVEKTNNVNETSEHNEKVEETTNAAEILEDNKNKEEPKPDPVDCVVDVEIEGGGYTARIRARSPKYEGKEVSFEQIKLSLEEKGVSFGIDFKAISTIINKKMYDEWITVAKCKPAEDGEKGSIEYLFETKTTGVPKEDARGIVDYKDLGTVRNITAGTVIAKITKETMGTPGINVKNEPIQPKPGAPAKVTHAENIALSDDGLQLVVTNDGNLTYKSGRFGVETVVKIDGDVDVATGNIDFIGEVVVRGDVKEGFSVTSGKSITVQGGVFGAKLTAVEKIIGRNGAIGSELIAGSSVEIDFAENTSITCYESLKAKTLYYCDVYCKGEVFVNSGNGSIIGGKIISTKNLYANVIGTKSYVLTQIIIGDNAIMLQERTGLIQKVEALNNEEEKCSKIVEYLMNKKEQLGGLPKDKQDTITLAAKTILLTRNEKEQLTKRIEEIDLYLQTKQNLTITCKKELYPGVKITINDTVFPVNTMYQHCIIGIGKEGIEVNNL